MRTWSRWVEIEEPPDPSYPKDPTDDHWQEWLDLTWRMALLSITTHYWECRWLIEMQESSSPKNHRELWQRRSMLAPVHYANLSSIPEFFDTNNENQPSIDYLVLQDAQMAAPEIAYPALRIAKCFLAIGDLQQPPLLHFGTKSLDKANLQDFGLPTDGPGSRFHSVGGDLLALANENCRMGLLNQPNYPRLSEHYRAVSSLVACANELAYQGTLSALRSDDHLPFPTVGHMRLKGTSEPASEGNRRNPAQAKAIVNWIQQNQFEIYQHYFGVLKKDQRGINLLASIILLLTQFSAQASLLREEFSRARLRIRCGTIQAFQRSESPIVLFSPVYGPEESDLDIFTHHPDLLTTALSRAQDAFLIFGGPVASAHTPWGKLLACTTPLYSARVFLLQNDRNYNAPEDRLRSHHCPGTSYLPD